MQLVRDDNDSLAVGAHVAQHVKELVRLLRRQNGGRLVEDQHVGPAVEDLDDLDGLLLRDRHVVDLLRRVDVKAVAVTDLLHLPVRRGHVELLPVVQAKHDVLRCCEHVDQLVVLMDHADLVVERVFRAADRDGLPADQDLSAVREINSGQHVHQRRLAAPVFAEQRQNFAVVDRQADVVIGHHTAEALRNVSQFHCANSFQGCHPFFSGCEHLIIVFLLYHSSDFK